MSKIEHIYLAIGNEYLEDYTGYTNYVSGKYSVDKYPLVVNEGFRLDMVQHIDTWCDKNYVPKPGEEIHVVPDCILPIQDLRNNYKIKRAFDSASCNVFCNITEKKGHPFVYHHWMIDREKKIVVYLWDRDKNLPRADVISRMESLLPASTDTSNFEHYCFCKVRITYLDVSESYRKLIMGQSVTPCVYYERLPMNRNELTTDLVYLVYKLGSDYETEHSKYALQLSALAQANWKEYPYMMYMLFEQILKYRGTHYYFSKHSTYPKNIQELMTYKFKHPADVSKKDLNVFKEFCELLFNIKDTRFVSLTQLRSKLSSTGIPEDAFCKVYNTMVKIDLKREED